MGGRRERIGVVGAGLIGGSIAHAAAASGGGPGEVAVWDHGAGTRAALTAAGFRVPADIGELATSVDVAFVAVPPTATAQTVRALLDADPDLVVADTASVKEPVWAALHGHIDAGALARFVPAHPLAGSAKHGWESASTAILADAVWAVCPDREATGADAVARVITAVTARVAGRVLMVGVREHDRALAYTSHMPHIAASALVRTVAADVGSLRFRLSGGSLRDATRVAAASPALWEDILRHNRTNLLAALDEFTARLAALRELVAEDRWDDFCNEWVPGVAEREELQRIRWSQDRPRITERRPADIASLLELGARGALICAVEREGDDLVMELEPA